MFHPFEKNGTRDRPAKKTADETHASRLAIVKV
jgi:hypothetical protein